MYKGQTSDTRLINLLQVGTVRAVQAQLLRRLVGVEVECPHRRSKGQGRPVSRILQQKIKLARVRPFLAQGQQTTQGPLHSACRRAQQKAVALLKEFVHRPRCVLAYVLEDVSIPPEGHRRVGVT